MVSQPLDRAQGGCDLCCEPDNKLVRVTLRPTVRVTLPPTEWESDPLCISPRMAGTRRGDEACRTYHEERGGIGVGCSISRPPPPMCSTAEFWPFLKLFTNLGSLYDFY